MSVSENIILGIVSGLLTSMLAFFLLQIFKSVILPWYQKVTYNGLDISGQWLERHMIAGILNQESTITIRQVSHKIKGEITIVKRGASNEVFKTKHFGFEGSFYDTFINISCWNKDKKQLGTTNYILQIKGNGSSFCGQKCWYDVGTNQIKSEEIIWNRFNSDNIIL